MDTIKQIQDYFEDLAKIHTDLLHLVDGRIAYARLNTDEQVTQITKKATANIVVIAQMNGERTGELDDHQVRRGISIIFASRAITSGPAAAAIDAANEKAEQIMFDFISKMEIDQTNQCGLNLDLEHLSWDAIDGPWLENYFGWMLFVPFRGYLTPYNPEKWTDQG